MRRSLAPSAQRARGASDGGTADENVPCAPSAAACGARGIAGTSACGIANNGYQSIQDRVEGSESCSKAKSDPPSRSGDVLGAGGVASAVSGAALAAVVAARQFKV